VITVHLTDGRIRRVDAVSAAYEPRGLTSLRTVGAGGGWSEWLVCRDGDGRVVREFARPEVRAYAVEAEPS
jgi:hypothetical protein